MQFEYQKHQPFISIQEQQHCSFMDTQTINHY